MTKGLKYARQIAGKYVISADVADSVVSFAEALGATVTRLVREAEPLGLDRHSLEITLVHDEEGSMFAPAGSIHVVMYGWTKGPRPPRDSSE